MVTTAQSHPPTPAPHSQDLSLSSPVLPGRGSQAQGIESAHPAPSRKDLKESVLAGENS